MNDQTVFPTITSAQLDDVCGGIDRSDYANAGGHLADAATVGGAAAAGTFGGPGGAAAGAAGGTLAVASGIPQKVGRAVGGAFWDAGSALGEGAYNAYSGVRRWFGGR